MAYAVLEQDEEISRLSIQEETETQLFYNPAVAERIGWYSYGNMAPLTVSEEDYPALDQEDGDTQTEESWEQ
jgi:hypothetical protein